MSMLKWALFIPIAGFLAWRVVTLNLADYYADLGTPEGSAAALNWRPDHPKALVDLALARIQTDPADASRLLRAALKANPTDGRALAMLGAIEAAQKNPQRVRETLELADRLAPQRTDVQSLLAKYWIQVGDAGKAMHHLSKVMTNNPSGAKDYYPQLLTFAGDARTRSAFLPLMSKKLTWWPGFFNYAAVNAAQTDTLRALYQMQGKGPNAADDRTLPAYLARLQREGQVMEAYFAWLNFLDKNQLGQLGNVFNGGFELPITGLGFDWIPVKSPHVAVDTTTTYGITGNRGLRVSFNGQRVRPQVLSQRLVLAPGDYSLRGRGRTDGLKAERGIQWAIYCLGQNAAVASTDRFSGTDQWQHFSAKFKVPSEGCPAQDLRLEVVGSAALDYEVEGVAWFDDMSIQVLD
jgi:hypothetical protein